MELAQVGVITVLVVFRVHALLCRPCVRFPHHDRLWPAAFVITRAPLCSSVFFIPIHDIKCSDYQLLCTRSKNSTRGLTNKSFVNFQHLILMIPFIIIYYLCCRMILIMKKNMIFFRLISSYTLSNNPLTYFMDYESHKTIRQCISSQGGNASYICLFDRQQNSHIHLHCNSSLLSLSPTPLPSYPFLVLPLRSSTSSCCFKSPQCYLEHGTELY